MILLQVQALCYKRRYGFNQNWCSWLLQRPGKPEFSYGGPTVAQQISFEMGYFF